MDLKGEVQEIFRRVFDDKDLEISEETTAKDIEGWDSMAQISLLSAIQEHFGVRFKLQEIMKLRNVGDMLAIVRERRQG